MKRTWISLAVVAVVVSACTESPDIFVVDSTVASTTTSLAATTTTTTSTTTTVSTTTSSPVTAGGVIDNSVIEGLVVFPERSRNHRDGVISYDIVPPPGGDHAPFWLICDVYDEPVPTEYAVHSMEHGAVWITYDPALPDGAVAEVEGLAEIFPSYVIVSPLVGNPGAVVATTWEHQLTTDDPLDQRLATFVEMFAGGAQGGEPGAPCVQGGVTPDQALRERDGTVDT